jgi:hypothetical protein
MIFNDTIKATVKDAGQKLTDYRKRDLMTKVAEDYFAGSARKAETVFGWSRKRVQLGLNERHTGLRCLDNYGARGRHKSEIMLPNLTEDISAMVDMQSQADPKFQSTFLYTRVSARGVREELVKTKGYDEAKLPSGETIGAVLNRMGYRLKKHKRQNP